MAEIQERLDAIQERAKNVSEALEEAEAARLRAKHEIDSLPDDLAALRDQLRRITAFPIADTLER